MTDATRKDLAAELLDRYGHRSLAEEAEIQLDGEPHHLFQLLELAALTDGRADPGTAVRTFVTLRDNRWSTAGHVRHAGPGQITRALRDAGYPEGDAGRISTALTDAALHLLDDHGGDLGGLREDAGRDPERERELLGHFAEVGSGIVDAFCREAQPVWPELSPCADKAVLDAAGRLGLGEDTRSLRSLARDDREFVRLTDALLRVRHEEDGYAEVRDRAARRA
ncbi:hypothetical protein [Streptomyces sp. JJ36]|uniref:hypothetical protein n=1 Tax=Streptomyces sp. JJ36 TaxID=2736645 RepID=UPI001F24514E|nr:hypothetical protein [Streptomyces sp. JJ36]MCF6525628.1 hypothetical protein [Streptomyces sp. JJ36]